MRKSGLVVAAMLAAVPVTAEAMSVAEFVAKGEALRAKGVLALTSSDIALLRDEVKAAAASYRASLKADLAAGRKPSSCPPPVGQSNIEGRDVLAYFKTLPAAQQKQSVKAAFPGLMKQRYPCK